MIDPGHQLGNHNFPRKINRLVPAGGFRKPCNTTGTVDQRRLPRGDVHLAGGPAAAGPARAARRPGGPHPHANSRDAWGPCVDERGRAGNRIGADLKISIHGDGSYGRRPAASTSSRRPTAGRGPHDIYRPSLRGSPRRSAPAPRAGPPGGANYIAGGDGLDVRADLGTLNLSDVPTVMVELGNMRSRSDARRMTSRHGRGRLRPRSRVRGLPLPAVGRVCRFCAMRRLCRLSPVDLSEPSQLRDGDQGCSPLDFPACPWTPGPPACSS